VDTYIYIRFSCFVFATNAHFYRVHTNLTPLVTVNHMVD